MNAGLACEEPVKWCYHGMGLIISECTSLCVVDGYIDIFIKIQKYCISKEAPTNKFNICQHSVFYLCSIYNNCAANVNLFIV